MSAADTLLVTILGCGSSGGVPRVGGDWGRCDPADSRNHRTRCGLLVQRWKEEGRNPHAATTVLVDTSADLRAQLLAADVRRIDGVLFSHAHADQTHGIDDVRAISQAMRRPIPAWMDPPTRERLRASFAYCFEGAEGEYPPILNDAGGLFHGVSVSIDGPGGRITATPLEQDHGVGGLSLGFRFGGMAYSNDVVHLPNATLEALKDLDLWIVDCLRYTPHPTHAHLERVMGWIERLQPQRVVLTNLHVDMDYAELSAKLPSHVTPAVDGMKLEIESRILSTL